MPLNRLLLVELPLKIIGSIAGCVLQVHGLLDLIRQKDEDILYSKTSNL